MKKIKTLISIFLIATMMLAVIGCGQQDDKKDDNTSTATENNTGSADKTEESGAVEISGTVTISGSTSVEKIGTATVEEFMAMNPKVEATYDAIGSSGGVKNAHEGVTQIGTASRNIKEKEKAWELTETVIAYDGVAVITHPSNPIEALTKEQVRQIYTGEITNWSDVGGNDEEIVVVSREDGSGTRGAFEEIVDFENQLIDSANIANGNGNVQTTVAGNPQAIGYVSFTYINETVKPMDIDGVAPTTENVLAGEYSISRPFIMVYHEESLNDAAKAYMEFILSEEGQVIVEEEGGIPVN